VVGTFKANNPLNTFLLFIYGLLLKFSYFSLLPIPITKKTDGILYKDLLLGLQTISNNSPFVYSLITYMLLFTQAISFNKIVNDQRLIQRPTYLPAMSYLLITSMFPEWNILSSALIVNTLLIWVWFKIYRLHNTLHAKTGLFNIGMIIGISAFFYFPSLAFTLLIVLALIVIRPFNLTEWIIALIGIITPYYYLLMWLFLSDNFKFYKFQVPAIGYPRFHQTYWEGAAMILILTIFLTGAYFVQANIRKQAVQIRKSWSLILIYLLIAVFIPFMNDTRSFQNWIVTAVPLSAFTAAAFLYPSKKWFPFLLHWLMVGFVIVISYYNK
jgi:Family of unknown function (DUF6427)